MTQTCGGLARVSLAVALLATAAMGCAERGDGKATIYYLVPGLLDEFQTESVNAIEATFGSLGYDVVTLDGQNRSDVQLNQLDDALLAGVDIQPQPRPRPQRRPWPRRRHGHTALQGGARCPVNLACAHAPCHPARQPGFRPDSGSRALADPRGISAIIVRNMTSM